MIRNGKTRENSLVSLRRRSAQRKGQNRPIMISAFSPFDQSAIGSYRELAGFLQYRACASAFFPFRSSLTSFRLATDGARGVVQCGRCAGVRPARFDDVHQVFFLFFK
jgi:hypothetical protein